MLCSLSSLQEKDLERIRSLEADLGRTILAFSCHNAAPAKLDDADLAKLQGIEKEMGLSLVAVD